MTNLILHLIILLFCFSSKVTTIISTIEKIESSIIQELGNTPNAASFAQFVQLYEKKYESIEEMKHRFGIFCKNLEFITSTNMKNLSYTVGINEFADWSWEEFKQRRLGFKSSHDFLPNLKDTYSDIYLNLPKTKDWREEGIVSPVKKQTCGDCYAFSAIAALEAAYHQAFKEEIILSEQQLVDCSKVIGNYGCYGGNMNNAFQYILEVGGLETQDSYPYEGSDDGPCFYTPDEKVLSLRGYVRIARGNENALKNSVANVRPVSVAFTALKSFEMYTGGIYKEECEGHTRENHALLLVGYGEENGVPYWIAKNSWGKQWGEQGYARILMGKNLCGIANEASFPSLDVRH